MIGFKFSWQVAHMHHMAQAAKYSWRLNFYRATLERLASIPYFMWRSNANPLVLSIGLNITRRGNRRCHSCQPAIDCASRQYTVHWGAPLLVLQ